MENEVLKKFIIILLKKKKVLSFFFPFVHLHDLEEVSEIQRISQFSMLILSKNLTGKNEYYSGNKLRYEISLQ